MWGLGRNESNSEEGMHRARTKMIAWHIALFVYAASVAGSFLTHTYKDGKKALRRYRAGDVKYAGYVKYDSDSDAVLRGLSNHWFDNTWRAILAPLTVLQDLLGCIILCCNRRDVKEVDGSQSFIKEVEDPQSEA